MHENDKPRMASTAKATERYDKFRANVSADQHETIKAMIGTQKMPQHAYARIYTTCAKIVTGITKSPNKKERHFASRYCGPFAPIRTIRFDKIIYEER